LPDAEYRYADSQRPKVSLHQFENHLIDIEPPIWRRIYLPSNDIAAPICTYVSGDLGTKRFQILSPGGRIRGGRSLRTEHSGHDGGGGVQELQRRERDVYRNCSSEKRSCTARRTAPEAGLKKRPVRFGFRQGGRHSPVGGQHLSPQPTPTSARSARFTGSPHLPIPIVRFSPPPSGTSLAYSRSWH
jgi:hypothetical protein